MLTDYIKVSTKGNNDIVDITMQVQEIVQKRKIKDGVLFLSVVGSTAGLSTMEYEPGLSKDLKESFDNLFPPHCLQEGCS